MIGARVRLEGIHHITASPPTRRGTSTSTRACSACGWSRRRSTRTTRPSTTCSTPTRQGIAGSDITFFEYPGARRGPRRRRDGAPDRLARRLGRGARLLGAAARRGRRRRRAQRRRACSSHDPEGLELRADGRRDATTRRWSPTTRRSPPSSRCRGSTRCAPTPPTRSAAARLLEDALGFDRSGDGAGRLRGDERGGLYFYDAPPAERAASQGAGTVHHVAWASPMDEQRGLARRVAARPAPRRRR